MSAVGATSGSGSTGSAAAPVGSLPVQPAQDVEVVTESLNTMTVNDEVLVLKVLNRTVQAGDQALQKADAGIREMRAQNGVASQVLQLVLQMFGRLMQEVKTANPALYKEAEAVLVSPESAAFKKALASLNSASERKVHGIEEIAKLMSATAELSVAEATMLAKSEVNTQALNKAKDIILQLPKVLKAIVGLVGVVLPLFERLNQEVAAINPALHKEAQAVRTGTEMLALLAASKSDKPDTKSNK